MNTHHKRFERVHTAAGFASCRPPFTSNDRTHMTHTRLFLSLCLIATLVGCERNPSNENAAPAGSSVRILSTTPDTSVLLHVGEHVKLQVAVEYNLTADRGTLDLVVQAADNSGVAHDMEVVKKGAGKTKFEAEFVVPNTKAIQVFTPLSAQSQSATSTVDMWAFKVVQK